MVLITIITGAYKQTYNWGAPHSGEAKMPIQEVKQTPAACLGIEIFSHKIHFGTLSLTIWMSIPRSKRFIIHMYIYIYTWFTYMVSIYIGL